MAVVTISGLVTGARSTKATLSREVRSDSAGNFDGKPGLANTARTGQSDEPGRTLFDHGNDFGDRIIPSKDAARKSRQRKEPLDVVFLSGFGSLLAYPETWAGGCKQGLPVAHAQIEGVRQQAQSFGSWRVTMSTLDVADRAGAEPGTLSKLLLA